MFDQNLRLRSLRGLKNNLLILSKKITDKVFLDFVIT